jgi:dTDP-4-dehydrorhamnose reductase
MVLYSLNNILVVGGDSNIGKCLVESLKTVGSDIFSTTCFPKNVNERCFYLDLSDDIDKWQMPLVSIKTVFICAAITSHEQCKLNPEYSWRVNVHGTVRLATRLVESGAFVIFLSSNAVFNGELPFAKHSDSVSPQTEYGSHKAETEEQLLKMGKKVAIVRFSKVITPEMPLIKSWIDDLRNRKVIHPFSNMMIAPVPIAFAVSVLKKVALKQVSGIIQVSADRDLTYANLAKHLVQKLGLDEDLIKSISYKETGLKYAAKNTTLDCSRLLELGLNLPEIWTSINDTFLLD